MEARPITIKSNLALLDPIVILAGTFLSAMIFQSKGDFTDSVILGAGFVLGIWAMRLWFVYRTVKSCQREKGRTKVYVSEDESSDFEDDLYLAIWGTPVEAEVTLASYKNYFIFRRVCLSISYKIESELRTAQRCFDYSPIAWLYIKPQVHTGDKLEIFLGSWGNSKNRPFTSFATSYFRPLEC